MVTTASEAEVPIHRTQIGAFVRSLLEQPAGRPWVMQHIGLLSLRLGKGRERRLHLWDPAAGVDDPVIHDHPFDFTSTVIAGEITNTLYGETPSGFEYRRDRYAPPDEQSRVTDTIRLSGRSTRYTAGQSYRQAAHELHDSAQILGTVTLLRCTFRPVDTLTVCRPPGSPWVTGQARPATAREVERITAAALGLMA